MPNSTYHVTFKRETRNSLHVIPSHIAQQARQIIDTHLRHQPTQRIPGKLKRLKGQLADVWQAADVLEGIIQPGEDGETLAPHPDVDFGDDLRRGQKPYAAADHRLYLARA